MISFLLHDICPEITDNDKLIQVYQKSLQIGLKSTNEKKQQNPSQIYDNRKNKLIDQIASVNNFRRSVVKKAVAKYGTLNTEAIIEYCCENDVVGDEEDNKHDSDSEFMDSQETPINLNPINLNDASLSKHIQVLWDSFLEKQNGFSKSFLTIEHLAQFLELIYENTNEFQRSIPGYLTNKGNCKLINKRLILSLILREN